MFFPCIVDTSDPVAFILSIIRTIIGVEKTTFFHILGMTVSLWDIDITFGTVQAIIITLIPTMRSSDENEGTVSRGRKL